MKRVWRYVQEDSWLPHPTAKNVSIKPLVSEKEDGVGVTCMLVRIPAGMEVPEHIHEEQDDILYPLEGRAVMWVEGTRPFPLEPGVIVRVPKGTKHKIEQVSEDVLLYDVFSPALI